MSVTRYRKGILSVPKLYTSEIDSLSAGITIKEAGVARAAFLTGTVTFGCSVALAATRRLNDALGNALLDPDDTGNIATLAPLTGALQYPAGYTSIYRSAVECWISGGSIVSGIVRSSTTETLVFALPPVATSLVNQVQYLDHFEFTYNTDNNGAYITAVRLCAYTYGGRIVLTTWSDDLGNGSTGRHTTDPYTRSNTSLGSLALEIDVVRTAGNVDIEEIGIYSRVTA
jgi:hypothetical protein